MEQFTQAFLEFRDRMEAGIPDAFKERQRGVMIAGRGCALAVGYSLWQERKIFGMVGTGSQTHSHEQRLLFSAPDLTVEELEGWRAYALDALKERIQMDLAHEFTILSIVLAVDGVSREVQKALRRADIEQKYGRPNAGWAQVRFLVVDLAKKKLYPSTQGKPLANLMKGIF